MTSIKKYHNFIIESKLETWNLDQFEIGKEYKCVFKSSKKISNIKILDKKHGQLKISFLNSAVIWVFPSGFKVFSDNIENPKVKWYKKGNFFKEEDWVNEAIDRDGIEWDKRWEDLSKFEIGNTYKCVSFGNLYEITVLEKNYKCQMKIRFKRLGNFIDAEQWVNASKFTIIDEVKPKQPHVKWYSKGKLSQEEDWVNESEQGDRLFKNTMLALSNFQIGDSCKIKDSLIYLYSDKEKYGKYSGIESKIIDKGNSGVKVEFPDGVKAWLNPMALNKVELKKPKQHVKWYSKGKFFDEETDWD